VATVASRVQAVAAVQMSSSPPPEHDDGRPDPGAMRVTNPDQDSPGWRRGWKSRVLVAQAAVAQQGHHVIREAVRVMEVVNERQRKTIDSC
jgi:hypothetical protein